MSKALIIPPRPSLLIELQGLLQVQEPDIKHLIKVIKQDVALYTILLSVVNSPIYRRANAIASIEQALIILGAEKVSNLIEAVLLRSQLEQVNLFEEFWSSTTEVATICSVIAEQFIIINPELAYKVGMLHATGVPVMLNNIPDYKDFIHQHGTLNSKDLCYLEREAFSTDRYQQGYKLAQLWNMSEVAALTVRYQPITMDVLKDPKHLPIEIPTLLALLKLAKVISNEYRQYWRQSEELQGSQTQLRYVLEYLHISQDDFYDIREQLSQRLLQNTEF